MRMKMIGVLLDEETFEEVRRLGFERNLSKSELLRDIIKDYLLIQRNLQTYTKDRVNKSVE